MKIALITRDLRYGMGIHVRNLIINLISYKEIKKILLIGPEKIEFNSDKIHQIIMPVKGKYFITKEPIFAIRCSKILNEILKKENYDIIHTHSNILFKTKNQKLKIVSTFHTTHYGLNKNINTLTIKDIITKTFHNIYKYLDNFRIKNSDRIICVSNRTKEEISRNFPKMDNKIQFIPNGVNTKIFRPIKNSNLKEKFALDKNKKIILFVGRLEYLQGLIRLAEILRSIDDIILIVIGDGPDKEKLKEYPFIKYFGFCPHDKLYEFYNVADIFILPSMYENFPMTILEAMACGTPVIATNTGENSNLLKDCGLIIDLDNKKDTVYKIRLLLNSKRLRNILSKKALLKINRDYKWEKIAKKIFQLYKN